MTCPVCQKKNVTAAHIQECAVSRHAAAIGSVGGKAGTGKAKARTTAQARKAARASHAARRRNKLKALK